jgi:hypothetical protein
VTAAAAPGTACAKCAIHTQARLNVWDGWRLSSCNGRCKSRGEASPDRPRIMLTRGLVRAVLVVLAFAPTLAAACGWSPDPQARIVPVYDERTGKLQLLRYDSNGNGRIDTWSHMDGARVERIEIDSDEDGKIDRWEYYGARQTLEKIGHSRANDGRADAWSYVGPDGALMRVDVSTRHDGKVTRVEHFAKNVLTRAEEDTNGDGRPDKWETFDEGRLTSVSFDTTHRRTADRRLVYGAEGGVRAEVDLTGDGHFAPISVVPSTRIGRR